MFWRMKEDDERNGMEEGGIPEFDVNVLHNLDKRKRLKAAAAKVMRFSALITYKLSSFSNNICMTSLLH